MQVQMMLKEPLVKALKGEVKQCKKLKQRRLWVNWLYNDSRLNFFDTQKQYVEQGKNTYIQQGYNLVESKSRPESARMIGAKAVLMHVFRSTNYSAYVPDDPLGALWGGYINSKNEFCIYEIII
jgi:hypothetical protein